MDKEKSSIDILTEKYNELHSQPVSIDRLNEEFDLFESFIPEFFSKNGEADGIKNMYKNIRESKEDKITISCCDLNNSMSNYNEFMEGVVTFINDINNVDMITESNSFDKYKSQFEMTRSNSDAFIESLFTPNSKYSVFTDTVLTEAVTNIEYLIEFIPKMKEFRSVCNNFNSLVSECTDENKKKLLNDTIDLLYESVGNYGYATINNIVNTYYDINNALDNKDKKEETVTFKLF